MIEEENLEMLSDFYRTMGDLTRLRILDLLRRERMCVYKIAMELNMTQSAISHQLQYLRQMDFVRTEKIGKQVFYELADDHIEKMILLGYEHIKEAHNDPKN